MLTNATGEHWRSIRTAVSPTFTKKKVKKLLPLIKEKIQQLMKITDNLSHNHSFEVIKFYKYFFFLNF